MDDYELFKDNLNRVESIVKLFDRLKDKGVNDYKTTKKSDLLRAAVVFLHSSFENYFREIIKNLVINSNDNTIIINLLSNLKKIQLEDLLENKNTNIKLSEYINKLVEKRMLLSSFNSVDEIVGYLNIVKISSDFEHKSEIEEFIKRRHKIVHEADKNISESSEKLNPIYKEWFDMRKKYLIELVDFIENEKNAKNYIE